MQAHMKTPHICINICILHWQTCPHTQPHFERVFFNNRMGALCLKAKTSTINPLLVALRRKHYCRLWKSSALVNSDEHHYCDYCSGTDMPASLSFLILHQAQAGGDLVLLSPNWMWPFLGDRAAVGVFLLLWESVNKKKKEKKNADQRTQRKVLISPEIK